MSNTDTASNTHTATRLDDDDPVPGQDSPAHDRLGLSSWPARHLLVREMNKCEAFDPLLYGCYLSIAHTVLSTVLGSPVCIAQPRPNVRSGPYSVLAV
jgi:hypothetical protein